MKSDFLPKTTLGKWSIGLVIVAICCFVVFIIEVALGLRGGDSLDFSDPSQLGPAIPILLAGVFFVSAMVTGLIGIVKNRERSVLVFLAVAIGMFVLLLVLGEFLAPH
jgi:hypothetical protein